MHPGELHVSHHFAGSGRRLGIKPSTCVTIPIDQKDQCQSVLNKGSDPLCLGDSRYPSAAFPCDSRGFDPFFNTLSGQSWPADLQAQYYEVSDASSSAQTPGKGPGCI